VSGLISGTVQGASIYRVIVTDSGDTPVVTNLTRIASGLRNAAGIAFRPATGDLYLTENGIDGLSDPDEPLSADELNVIPAASLGTTVPNFGFPSDYIVYRTGAHVDDGSGAAQPLVAFQPIPDPSTGSESEGASEMVFAPTTFPAGLNNGVFVGFHGKFSDPPSANEENPVVYVDLATRAYVHFISNGETKLSHPDGLLATADSLFISDLDSTGTLVGNGGGVIYQISAALPDLVTTAVSAPSALKQGDSVTITDTVVNQGPAGAPASTTRYYLSSNTIRDAGDVLLTGQRTVAALAAGSTSTGSAVVTVPATTKTGTYFVLACADDVQAINERVETNNCRATAKTVKVQSAPGGGRPR
jgi:hypothetical protein